MSYKPKVYLISNVFTPEEIGSNEKISQNVKDKIKSLWKKLNTISTFASRSFEDLQRDISTFYQ